MNQDTFIIHGQEISSRLLVGTGKFPSPQVLAAALDAADPSIITVALRRVNFDKPSDDLMSQIDLKRYILMPNTSGARTADEAVRLARLARSAGNSNWIKVELTPEPNYLFPDPIETLKASEQLVKEGFIVLPYMNADPILAKRLEEVGVAAVMPLAAPIGSNKGLLVKELLRIIIEQASVPVIIDAGIGAPSHAVEAMEMGADAVLLNTAIATAKDPIRMAAAFKDAVRVGREAFLAGLPNTYDKAVHSSPLTGFLN